MKEIISSIILIILLISVLNPFHFWMPDMMHTIVLVALLAVFGLYTAFILREKVIDERDSIHRSLAGWTAFLAGSSVLIIGIVYQSFKTAIDPWLIATLVIMILVKLGTHLYSDKKL